MSREMSIAGNNGAGRWGAVDSVQRPKRWADRALAFTASSARFFLGAVVSSDRRRRAETPAISSIAASNAPSLLLDGLLKPLIFRTNWRDAALISSSVTGGSKLNNGLMFRHMTKTPRAIVRRSCAGAPEPFRRTTRQS